MAKQAPPRTLAQRAKHASIAFWQWSKTTAQKKWQQYESKIAKITNITMAASSATSTFTLTLSILPIIASMLTIVAAAPLFSFLIPELIYSPFFYYPAIIGLSAIAGYMTYHSQVERAKLDHQIKENKEINGKLLTTVNKLEKALAQNQRHLNNQTKKYEKLQRSVTAKCTQMRNSLCKLHPASLQNLSKRSVRSSKIAKPRLA